MDLQSIIIGVITIALCFLPYVYFTKKNKKRDQQFFQLLLDKANQLNCNLTTHEVTGNIIIGLDDEKKELFFLKRTRNYERLQHLNLNEMKKVKLNNVSRMVGPKESKQKVIDKLQLIFTPIDTTKRDIIFEFYNSDETLVMNGELQLIEKWSKILTDKITPQPIKPFTKKAA
ncbi:MAG: hypothetical protein KDD24_02725 [Flavobacteriales bacterium]|nr:hypothetical protein [Flavobacteriales bacterium]